MRGLKRLLAGVLLLAALGLTAFLVAYFVGAQGGGDVTVKGLLRVSSRTHLSLCVDGADGLSVSDGEVETIRQALEATLAAAPDLPPEYRDGTVSRGCPPPVALTGEALDASHRYGLVPARLVTSPNAPSPHSIHVYFVPADVYAASFGGDAYATTAEERICEGDDCPWVTQGLYVRPSVSSDVLGRALRSALVLLPPLPEPTEFWQVCMSGTPEAWCYQYEYCQGVPTDPDCKDYGAEPTERPETPLSP